ncbi:MAG: hypothetical protein WBR18_06605 [Anaerolineales bacterium]
MTVRRSIVWVISVVFGVAVTYGTIAFFGTTLARFSISNALLVFFSIGSLAFIWLDFILRTQYLHN